MKKLLIIIGILLVVGTVGFFAFNQYIYNQKQGSGEPVVPYEGTLSGTYVCLPHKDTTGPQTLECAFGLKTQTGEYYALDFGQGDPTQFMGGQEVTLTGTITPIEMLSSDQWQKYDVVGILSVKTTSDGN